MRILANGAIAACEWTSQASGGGPPCAASAQNRDALWTPRRNWARRPRQATERSGDP